MVLFFFTLKEINLLIDNICSSLRFLNQRVDTKLIFLEKRITENEINVIISTSQEEEEWVWVDFSKLDILLSSWKEETTIFKISFKNRVEYHFAQEILNCPSKFYISKSNSLILKIEIILDENSKSEIYKEALVSLVDTLSKIYNASNEEFAKIYWSFIKLIFESYKLIKDDKFSRLKNDKNLFKFYNLIKQDSFVEKSTKAIYDKN